MTGSSTTTRWRARHELRSSAPSRSESAIGNRGTFDPNEGGHLLDRRRRAPVQRHRRRLSERAMDVIRSDSTIGVLGRTVGTPYHPGAREERRRLAAQPGPAPGVRRGAGLPERHQHLRQRPAELAPGVVPMLNKWSDARNPLRLAGEKRARLARALFEGTLGWTRDDQGNPVEAETRAAPASVDLHRAETALRFRRRRREAVPAGPRGDRALAGLHGRRRGGAARWAGATCPRACGRWSRAATPATSGAS